MSSQPRIETAIAISPLTVLVRGVLEWACPHPFFEALFDRECRPRQWNRKLAISAIAWLMLAVVAGVRRSVFAAFQADQASDAPTITASAAALDAKYGRIDPRYTTAAVRESGRRMHALLTAAGVQGPFGWEGYRITIRDGTDLGGTEHRLKPLRRIQAAGLPGRYVAAYDLATGLVVDAAAREDAYTSERELVRPILAAATPDPLFVADRNFCTTAILFGLMDRRAFFVIRQHDNNLRWRPVKAAQYVGRVATGEVWEQPIEAEDTASGARRRMRRILLKLDTPTEDGETEVVLLSNLKGICPLRICELYRDRWTIERHFALVKTVLHGEIEDLGRPRAALFALGMALVAANALSRGETGAARDARRGGVRHAVGLLPGRRGGGDLSGGGRAGGRVGVVGVGGGTGRGILVVVPGRGVAGPDPGPAQASPWAEAATSAPRLGQRSSSLFDVSSSQ